MEMMTGAREDFTMASTDQAYAGNAGWDSAQAAAQAFGYQLHPDYVARIQRQQAQQGK